MSDYKVIASQDGKSVFRVSQNGAAGSVGVTPDEHAKKAETLEFFPICTVDHECDHGRGDKCCQIQPNERFQKDGVLTRRKLARLDQLVIK